MRLRTVTVGRYSGWVGPASHRGPRKEGGRGVRVREKEMGVGMGREGPEEAGAASALGPLGEGRPAPLITAP